MEKEKPWAPSNPSSPGTLPLVVIQSQFAQSFCLILKLKKTEVAQCSGRAVAWLQNIHKNREFSIPSGPQLHQSDTKKLANQTKLNE